MLETHAEHLRFIQPQSVPDEAFRGPETQLFEGPIFSITTSVPWCPHNTRVHHAK